MNDADNIIDIYQRHGPDWAAIRDRSLVEKRWLDKMLAVMPRSLGRRRILDLGCGAGRPMGEYLRDRGMEMTGVDSAQSMLDLYAQLLPDARCLLADMRKLDLDEQFDAILAWDSLFHLTPEDQRATLARIATLAAPKAALLFTSGPAAGVSVGEMFGERLFHASLSPEDYRTCLSDAGFKVVSFTSEDVDCAGRSVWLARFTGE